MKLLTITVPCYNSQSYMHKCLKSLLIGGNEVEILIVNDGSTDQTAEIADEYALKYPEQVRVIHQKNGGHGAAVMAGLQQATGEFFKVVDSDDWLNEVALIQVIDTLRNICMQQDQVDLMVNNYVYDKVGVKRKKVVRYLKALPQHQVLGWDDVGALKKGQYILMHAIIYRTQLLRECNLVLPRHTFYVDNLYAFIPMQQVKRMYYLNVDLYHYFIGREDQSVNERIMIERIDQQIKVNKMMICGQRLQELQNPRLKKFLFNYLEIVTTVSTVLLIRSGTKENVQKKKDLWKFIREQDSWLFYRLRFGIMGQVMNIPGRFGRDVVNAFYKMSRRLVGFN